MRERGEKRTLTNERIIMKNTRAELIREGYRKIYFRLKKDADGPITFGPGRWPAVSPFADRT
jgi:hypothetical protein